MDRTKVYEFMVEDTAHYTGDLPYKITESYHPMGNFGIGYDIYQVETNDPSEIRVVFKNGIEYTPDNQFIKAKDSNRTVYVVAVWKPINN